MNESVPPPIRSIRHSNHLRTTTQQLLTICCQPLLTGFWRYYQRPPTQGLRRTNSLFHTVNSVGRRRGDDHCPWLTHRPRNFSPWSTVSDLHRTLLPRRTPSPSSSRGTPPARSHLGRTVEQTLFFTPLKPLRRRSARILLSNSYPLSKMCRKCKTLVT